jgi:hypothetical protein
MSIAKAVLLVGSAKSHGASTSEVLGRFLLEQLAAHGVRTSVHQVRRSPASSADESLLDDLTDADLFVLSSPLYVDSLPYLVTRTLEKIPATRTRPCACVALVNCGFPESQQCATALAIVRAFAQRAHFDWRGGLAIGGGGAIDGRRLEHLARMTRPLRDALKEAAESLAKGEPIPQTVEQKCARPLVPASFYTMMGNVGWYRKAFHYGVLTRLHDRPYSSPADGDSE